jgi:hypothetical protein
MRWINRLGAKLAVLAVIGMVLPQWGFASESAATKATPAFDIIDVTLREDGSLRGQVLDSQGIAVAAADVVVVHQGKVVATVQTDQDGRYVATGLKTGVYQIVTEKGITVCRLWSPAAAPPSSQAEALIVNGEQVIRGSLGGRSLGSWLSNPWVLGAIVAAAIAIPLALDDKKDGS